MDKREKYDALNELCSTLQIAIKEAEDAGEQNTADILHELYTDHCFDLMQLEDYVVTEQERDERDLICEYELATI